MIAAVCLFVQGSRVGNTPHDGSSADFSWLALLEFEFVREHQREVRRASQDTKSQPSGLKFEVDLPSFFGGSGFSRFYDVIKNFELEPKDRENSRTKAKARRRETAWSKCGGDPLQTVSSVTQKRTTTAARTAKEIPTGRATLFVF